MILNGVRGDAQTKRLSSQFIARFFTKFPNLANSSLDALLDLCEDDDVNIRKQAIKVINRLSTEPGFRELGISGSFLDLSMNEFRSPACPRQERLSCRSRIQLRWHGL